MSFGIRLPCIEFEAEVHVYGKDVPAPLELAAIKFIHARSEASERATLNDLVEFLGVGKSIAYHILIGFWTRGWALIYPESGQIVLSSLITDMLKKGNLTGMQPAIAPVRLKFIYDLIAGQIVPHPGDKVVHADRRSDAYTYPKRRPSKDEQIRLGRNGWQHFDMPLDGYLNASSSELQAALVMHPHYRLHLQNQAIEQLDLNILTPTNKLTPGMVRYYSAFFDVYKTSERLLLKVNDDRPIQRILGKRLETAIIDALPDGEQLEAALTREVQSNHAQSTPINRPLPKFADCVLKVGNAETETYTLDPQSFVLQDLAESWNSARTHLLNIVARRVNIDASKALLSKSAIHEHLRSQLSERPEQIVLSSRDASRSVIDASPDENNPAITSLLGSLANGSTKLFLATTKYAPHDIQTQFAQMEKPNSNRVRIYSNDGPHISASFAAFGIDKLLISSEPILTDFDQVGLSLVFETQSEGARARPLRELMDRLAKDFALNEPNSPHLSRSRETGPSATTPQNLSAMLQAVDTLIADRIPSLDEAGEIDDAGPSSSRTKFDQVKAQVWLEKLRSLSHDLESWVSQESKAAEVLVDSDIHDAAIAVLNRTPEEQPVVIGLSHITDLSNNLQMRAAIAERAKTCSGTIYLCLPGDPKATPEVEELTASFSENPKVKILLSDKNARWGFGFVITAMSCILASRGIGRRIHNIGRARRGTEIGVLLLGPELRELALEIANKTHSLESIFEGLTPMTRQSQLSQPSLLQLYSTWFSADTQHEDGNRGVTIVEPLLIAHPDMPWRPDDEALQVFPEECRHALLKSAARQALGLASSSAADRSLDEAPELLALKHWNSGEIFQAAILADEASALPIQGPVLREMALAVSLGIAYTGAQIELFGLELDDQQHTAFLSLAALLLLDGQGGELAEFIAKHANSPESKLELGDTPLDKLVVALAEFGETQPGTVFKANMAEDPDEGSTTIDILWQEAATYVHQRRDEPRAATSVQNLRKILFSEQGSLLGDLSILFTENANKNIDEEIKVSKILNIIGKYTNYSGIFDKKFSIEYFENSHNELSRRLNKKTNKNFDRILENRVGQERNSVVVLFEIVSNILSESKSQTLEARLNRNIGQISSAVLKDLTAEKRASSSPISTILAARLKMGYPTREYTVPIHLLPTGGAALSPLDWPLLKEAYFQAELTPEHGATPSSIMPLPNLMEAADTLPSLTDPEEAQKRWSTSWELLNTIESFGPKVEDAHELAKSHNSLMRLAEEKIAKIDKEARALQREKVRNDLVSSEFVATLKPLKEKLANLKDLTAENSTCVTQDLDSADALLSDLGSYYRKAFDEERKAIEEAQGVIEENKPSAKRQVRQLIEMGQLNAARWLSKFGMEVDSAEPLPEPDPSISATFQNIVNRSRSQQVAVGDLEDCDLPDESIPLFAALINLVPPARPQSLKSREIRDAIFTFFGEEPSDDDHVEDTESRWLINTGNPTLVAIAPYLVTQNGIDSSRIEIIIPKSRVGKAQVERQRTRSFGWRQAALASSSLSEGENPDTVTTTSQDSNDFSLLRDLAATNAAEPEEKMIIPLVIDAFPSAEAAPLPALTHRQLVALMKTPKRQRRRACTRVMMNLISPTELADWWHQSRSNGDDFKRFALSLIHQQPVDQLVEKSSDGAGLTKIVADTAEMLGVRINSQSKEDTNPAFQNWCNLRCIIYFSGGDLLNAHDLLFDGLRQDNRRRFIDLQLALKENTNGQSNIRFQGRLLPKSLAPQDGQQSSDLVTFLETVELASIYDDEIGFNRGIFLDEAKISMPGRDAPALFDDMVKAKLINPVPNTNRFELKEIPLLFSLLNSE